MIEPSATPVAFMLLHYLGGSRRSWDRVVERIGRRGQCIPIDLPGFGEDPAATGHAVTEMAEVACRAIRAAAPPAWVLVGHSMGAKVAALVARRAEDGEPGLGGLRGIVLIAGSPPAPEPMDDGQRTEMLGWFDGDGPQSRAEAQGYIERNVGQALPEADHAQAVADVLSARPAAWRAWLTSGSREDWAARIGVLQTPALIIAGEDDPELGPQGQRRYTMPHYAHSRLVSLPGAKHLLPYERPDDVARLILEHAA